MRNCEPYNEVSKGTLNPYYLQQGTAPFDDKKYKSLLFNRIQAECRSYIFYCFLLYTFIDNISYIVIYTDGFMPYFGRTNRLSVVNTSICGSGIFRRHLPKRIFDNNRGVMFIAHHFFGDHLRLMFWQHSGLHK